MAIAHPDRGNSRLPRQGLGPRHRHDRPLPRLTTAGPPCGGKRLLAGTILPNLALIAALAAFPAVAYAQSSTPSSRIRVPNQEGVLPHRCQRRRAFRRSDDHHRSDFGRTVGEIQDRRGRPGAAGFDKSFQTASGNFVTAVNGGGMTLDALHTDATQIRGWEQFRMNDLSLISSGATYYELYTIGKRDVTAVGAEAIRRRHPHRRHECRNMGGVQAGEVRGPGDGNRIFHHPQCRSLRRLGGLGAGRRRRRQQRGRNWIWRMAEVAVQVDAPAGRDLRAADIERFEFCHRARRRRRGAEEHTCHPGLPGACIDSITDIFDTDATRSWDGRKSP